MRAPRILVVDDNETLRTLVAQALESAGFVAIPADSGEMAFEVASFDPPDLLVVDHVMPGMSGAELIASLRTCPDARLRPIPCIGVTAFGAAEGELLQAGAVAALRKPVQEGELLAMVRRALPAEIALAS